MPVMYCRECERRGRAPEGSGGRRVDNPYEQFRERIEYTRVDGQERRLSRTVRDICRDCVDDIKAKLDHKDGAEQGTLL